jgi:hypothetical protein
MIALINDVGGMSSNTMGHAPSSTTSRERSDWPNIPALRGPRTQDRYKLYLVSSMQITRR